MTKNARNIRRVLRRSEREQRVKAGKPSARLDYQCPLCEQWFSTYRSRHDIHRAHCKKKRARETVARVERNRTTHPSLMLDDSFASKSLIPAPDSPLAPCSPTPDSPLAPRSPTPDSPLAPRSLTPVPFSPLSIAPSGSPVLDDSVTALPAGESDLGESDLPNRHRVRWGCLRQQDPGESSQPSKSAVQDPITWPLELGQTLVVYHPHAQRLPQVIPTSELPTLSRHPNILEDCTDDTRPPYFPFETLADFEQTEIFVKRNCTDPFINEQLDLWRRYAPNDGVTLKNAREMHQYLWAAGIEEDLSQVAHNLSPLDLLQLTALSLHKWKSRFHMNASGRKRCGSTPSASVQFWMLSSRCWRIQAYEHL